jgi:hypothetical protein
MAPETPGRSSACEASVVRSRWQPFAPSVTCRSRTFRLATLATNDRTQGTLPTPIWSELQRSVKRMLTVKPAATPDKLGQHRIADPRVRTLAGLDGCEPGKTRRLQNGLSASEIGAPPLLPSLGYSLALWPIAIVAIDLNLFVSIKYSTSGVPPPLVKPRSSNRSCR